MPTDYSDPCTELSAADSQLLRQWLAEFDQSWTPDRLTAFAPDLPPPGSPLRVPALRGLVEIDLQRQWQSGRRVQLESYLDTFPELGTRDTVPVALVQAELDARQKAGTAVNPSQLRLRFPRQAEQLKRRIDTATPPTPAPVASAFSTVIPAASSPAPPAAASPPPAPGQLPNPFGRYRIVRSLGRGGMGTVYLAHDTQLDRPVALKVPHFAAEDGPDVLARFLQEARSAGTLQHPNICPVYDVGAVGGTHYLTMAYIEGQPLSELVRGKRPLPDRQAAGLVRKLALALHEAHRRGIIHRDLKPSNVMITPGGDPVIMDFGLARRLDGQGSRLTQSGAILGTPSYMAPEQAMGDFQACGAPADIYSLGVVLFELLTGHVPFEGPTASVLARLLTEAPPPPSAFRPDLDLALEAVCRKAMAQNPSARFRSMADFAAALAEYLRGAQTPATANFAHESLPESTGTLPLAAPAASPRTATPVSAPRPPVSRSCGPVVAATVVVLLAVGAAAFWLMQSGILTHRGQPNDQIGERREEPAPTSGSSARAAPINHTASSGAEKPADVRMPPPAPAEAAEAVRTFAGSGGPIVSVAFARDGRSITAGSIKLTVRTWETATGKLIDGFNHNVVVRSVAISPDHKQFALARLDKMLDLYSYQRTGAGAPLLQWRNAHDVLSVAFSPDGQRLAAGLADHAVQVYDTGTGTTLWISMTHAAPVIGVAFSPDGKKLASGSRDGTIRAWDARTGRSIFTVTGDQGIVPSVAFSPDGDRLAGASQDGSFRVWDLRTGRESLRVKGHTKGLSRVAFSPDGRAMATASFDASARLWDAVTGRSLGPPLQHPSGVLSVAFSPDGQALVTGCNDGIARLWNRPK